MRQALQAFRQALTLRRLAALLTATLAALIAILSLSGGGQQLTLAKTSSQARVGCRGLTRAAIPAQGVIVNPGQGEGGHLWWQDTSSGTCVGTVIEHVEFTAAAPARTLRVIVFDTADPGGLTIARTQVTAAPGPESQAFAIHQVFTGLTAVCLAATSLVVASPDMPCVSFGRAPGTQQSAQSPATLQGAPKAQPPWL
jgi:hypothetical protein